MTRPRTRPQPRGGDGKFVRTIEAAQRDAEAARLRERGHTYRQIAAELGYADAGEAHHAVNRAFAAIPAEGVAELRAQMLAQLDYLTREAIKVLEARHVTVSNGKVVTLHGEPVVDDAPALQAIDRLLRIQERKADLVPGLKAPKRMEVVTLDWLDAQIATLTAEVDARAGELERADAEQAAAAAPAAQPPG
jgi:hypothetical protein